MRQVGERPPASTACPTRASAAEGVAAPGLGSRRIARTVPSTPDRTGWMDVSEGWGARWLLGGGEQKWERFEVGYHCTSHETTGKAPDKAPVLGGGEDVEALPQHRPLLVVRGRQAKHVVLLLQEGRRGGRDKRGRNSCCGHVGGGAGQLFGPPNGAGRSSRLRGRAAHTGQAPAGAQHSGHAGGQRGRVGRARAGGDAQTTTIAPQPLQSNQPLLSKGRTCTQAGAPWRC